MLSFVLGSPRSGKSDMLIQSAAKHLTDGDKVLFLVPEHNVLTTERKISRSFKASSALFDLDVTSFRRLANIVFRRCGGLCYNYLDKGGCAVMMWRTLTELSPILKTFKPGSSSDIGLVSSLISLCDEFANCCITPVQLEDTVDRLPSDMKDKVTDVATVYTRYDELIHDGFDSVNDDLVKAAELIIHEDIFSDTYVFIDGFSGFTPAEYKVLEALVKRCKGVMVTLSMRHNGDGEIFEVQYRTKKKLTQLAENNGVSVADDILLNAKRTDDLAFFEKYCFDSTSKESYNGEVKSVTAVSAADIYSECELISADIAKQIRNGRRYRDLCIVMGDPDAYASVLDVVFKRHNIPYHFSTKDDILQKPLIKLVICALNIIEYNWRLTDVISYLKTGYCGITDEECDIIEEYASTWSISGAMWKLDSLWSMNPDGYKYNESGVDDKRLIRINEIRDKLREPLMVLSDSISPDITVDKAAEAIYSFLLSCVDVDSLDDENTACWNALVSALEQLALCAVDVPMGDIEGFKRLVRLLTSQTAFSLIPSTVDEVSCISARAYDPDGVKKCYIIGLVDGVFPSAFNENLILNNDMRVALNKYDLNLPDDPDETHYADLCQFWDAMLSSEDIWISRYRSTLDGKEIVASPAYIEVKRLLVNITERSEKDFGIFDLVYDKASAFDRISDPTVGKAVLDILSEDIEFSQRINALSVPLTTGECNVTDPENLKRYEGDINLTQSRVDSFVHCKFAYQLQYVLQLNEQGKVTYDPRDVGTFIHALLEEFFATVRKRAKEGYTLTREEIEATVNRLVDSYIERTCGDTDRLSKRLQALFKRLRRHALLFVHSVYEEFENSDFEPVLFEVSITNNGDDAISPFRVELSDGSGVYIYGQIDRVDSYEKDGNVYIRVVDYKTGKKAFAKKDLEKGLNLQMFLYMFSIMEKGEKFCEKLGCNGELVPAGVLYYIARLPDSSDETLIEFDEAEERVIERIERQGMVLDDPDIIAAMSKDGSKYSLPKAYSSVRKDVREGCLYSLESLNEIKNTISETLVSIGDSLKTGKADAKPMKDSRSPCDYCRMRPVCRHLKDGGDGEDE